jgi:hypothetical protein
VFFVGLGRNKKDDKAVVSVAIVLTIHLRGFFLLVLTALVVFSNHLHIGLIQLLFDNLSAVLNESLMNLGLKFLPFLLLAPGQITIQ